MNSTISEKQAWEILAIGYLTRATGKVWDVERKQEHMDYMLTCKCEDQVISTSSFDLLRSTGDNLLDIIVPLLDMVIGLFNKRLSKMARDRFLSMKYDELDAEGDAWRPIKEPRLVCESCGSHDWFVLATAIFCRECGWQQTELIDADDNDMPKLGKKE